MTEPLTKVVDYYFALQSPYAYLGHRQFEDILEDAEAAVRTRPIDLVGKVFPATGGALYGRASHGWAASFLRQGPRTKIPGLYCAGGATHPSAGVPMAALSGQLAAKVICADRASTPRSRPADIRGGTSTRSARTGSTA